jgi:RNA polymerase sigma-70 factor (ECF subfamily)
MLSLVRQQPSAPVAQSRERSMPAPRPPVPSMPSTPPTEVSDEDLVRRARSGERRAFEQLVRRYQRPLYFLCRRYVHDHDAATDLVQRAFIRVMDKIAELREENIFRSWLYRIGVNLALNHLRDHARFVEEEAAATADEAMSMTAPEVMTQLEAAETASALREAVAVLPTKQRMTLELRVYEELSFKDIALALDTTEGAAKVNFHYAVRRLKALLGRSESGKAGSP